MADVLSADLPAFLKASARQRFDWSRRDCLSWLGEWVEVRHGINPATQFRDRYTTKAGAYRVIASFGSRTALIEAAVAPLSIQRTDTPQAGDIALLGAPEGEVGAIYTGRFFACLTPHGMRFWNMPVIAAWRV